MAKQDQSAIDASARADMQIVADIVRVNAKVQPAAVAMLLDEQETSYGELDTRASQVANGIISAGIAPQTRLALIDKNADNFFEILFGTAKSNTVMVAINWRLAPPEVAFVINDALAEILFVGREYVELVEAVQDQLTTVKKIIVLEGEHADWETYADWRNRQSAADPMLPIKHSDVAMQLYTSGTTGHPKGVQLTNDNIMAAMPSCVDWVDVKPDDISFVCMPFFHIAGSAWGLVGLYNGIKNVLVREINPPQILEIIEKERITKSFFVPAIILFLLQTPSIKTTDLSSLRAIFYGASPIPLDLLKQAIAVFKCGFAQVYGLTETTGAVTYMPPEDHANPVGNRLRSCGKALPIAEMAVFGADDKPVPTGEVGEIVCKSPLNMKGYWNLPQATANAIRGDWFYTGDAGYMDEDGYVYIHDRIKDMIISGAENIYPAEVESALFEHPAIADVAVIGVPDDKWGESVHAVVVTADGGELSAEEIIEFARERIAGYKIPRSIDFIAELPRNPSGKILKRELRIPYWEGHDRQVN
ncbi:MAG: fatty acid--CoA ligase [Anaerolineae bacterium]